MCLELICTLQILITYIINLFLSKKTIETQKLNKSKNVAFEEDIPITTIKETIERIIEEDIKDKSKFE